MLTQILQSLKDHWRKYAFLVLVLLAVLSYAYRAVSRAVHFAELYGESILRLSPGNVSTINHTSGNTVPNKPTNQSTNSIQTYVPPEGQVIITPKDPTKTLDQVINTNYKTWGFCKEFGLALDVAPLGIGLDMKFFFIKRFGAVIGIDHSEFPMRSTTPTLGVSYRLDRISFLHNTELVVKYAPLSAFPLWGGVRINL